jgi:hypothetical protein
MQTLGDPRVTATPTRHSRPVTDWTLTLVDAPDVTRVPARLHDPLPVRCPVRYTAH